MDLIVGSFCSSYDPLHLKVFVSIRKTHPLAHSSVLSPIGGASEPFCVNGHPWWPDRVISRKEMERPLHLFLSFPKNVEKEHFEGGTEGFHLRGHCKFNLSVPHSKLSLSNDLERKEKGAVVPEHFPDLNV